MTQAFRLPDLGEGIHEGEILSIHAEVGRQVKEGDIILEIETDKAAVEIPSPFDGTVGEVRVKPGDMARVGDILMVFDGEKAAAGAAEPAPEAATDATPTVPEGGKRRGQPPVPASPATRRLARELGVDLGRVSPTGRGGVVTAEDVRSFAQAEGSPDQPPTRAEEKHGETPATAEETPAGLRPTPRPAAGPPAPELPDFGRWGPVQRVPFRSIRRATARHMVTSWSQIPHVSSQDTVDITRLEAFRRKHKAEIEAAGGRLTLTDFVLKAAASALKTYPQFNASLDVAAQEIVLKQYYHIGVAVDTEDGLIVPVIRDVDRKSIKELAIELEQLARRTRAREVSREELQGGTFTITNAGAMGGGFFTPIINHPEVAILGMGRARMQPVVVSEDGESHSIEARLILPLVLCLDHRVVDGADAIHFLKVVADGLEDPDQLLMMMT
jgi:pyruvate dehydrogenase E2 component (dihydrolipoamide acetyltransferase)